MHVNTEEIKKCKNFRKKAFESVHPRICLLFASDDVTTVERFAATGKIKILAADCAATHRHNVEINS